MTYRTEFIPAALADWQTLPASAQNRILRKVQWLAKNFEVITPMEPYSRAPGSSRKAITASTTPFTRR